MLSFTAKDQNPVMTSIANAIHQKFQWQDWLHETPHLRALWSAAIEKGVFRKLSGFKFQGQA